MDFLLKKKKFKFQVDFMIADLTDVPFVVATLFAKVRLLDGGTFCEQSSRVAIVDHHVYWGAQFKFTTRIAANLTTGVLEPCMCRVSIRKELKGGKSHEKLGFVDVNLSEYAGSGVDGITRSYILEGYTSGHQRQDNSRLRINVSMMLLSADPCFKVPAAKVVGSALTSGKDTEVGDTGTIKARSAVNLSPAAEIIDLNPADRRAPNVAIPKAKIHLDDQMSVESGFDSLPRLQKTDDSSGSGGPSNNSEFIPGHSRDSSSASQQSRASGYASSLTHSRQSSSGQSESGHVRRASDGQLSAIVASTRSDRMKNRLSNLTHSDTAEGPMGATRVDADEIIATLFREAQLDLDPTKIDLSQPGQSQGLQLFINKEDGRTALGSQADSTAQMRRNFGAFEPVIVEHSEEPLLPPVFTCR